jgi:hypothetical protein
MRIKAQSTEEHQGLNHGMDILFDSKTTKAEFQAITNKPLR